MSHSPWVEAAPSHGMGWGCPSGWQAPAVLGGGTWGQTWAPAVPVLREFHSGTAWASWPPAHSQTLRDALCSCARLAAGMQSREQRRGLQSSLCWAGWAEGPWEQKGLRVPMTEESQDSVGMCPDQTARRRPPGGRFLAPPTGQADGQSHTVPSSPHPRPLPHDLGVQCCPLFLP